MVNYLFGNLDIRKNDLVSYLLECKIRLKTLIKTTIKKITIFKGANSTKQHGKI